MITFTFTIPDYFVLFFAWGCTALAIILLAWLAHMLVSRIDFRRDVWCVLLWLQLKSRMRKRVGLEVTSMIKSHYDALRELPGDQDVELLALLLGCSVPAARRAIETAGVYDSAAGRTPAADTAKSMARMLVNIGPSAMVDYGVWLRDRAWGRDSWVEVTTMLDQLVELQFGRPDLAMDKLALKEFASGNTKFDTRFKAALGKLPSPAHFDVGDKVKVMPEGLVFIVEDAAEKDCVQWKLLMEEITAGLITLRGYTSAPQVKKSTTDQCQPLIPLTTNPT